MLCKCGCGQPTPIATMSRRDRGIVKGQPVNYIRGHNTRGENHHLWKGDGVGYFALHEWVRANKERTEICTECGKKGKTDFANVSGEYQRDVEDYVELCRSCHLLFDRSDFELVSV